MGILRHTGGGLVVDAVLAVTLVQSSSVQVSDVPEHTAHQEILLDEPDQPLHLTFCKGMPGLAMLCPEADIFHKSLVILLPYGIPLEVPVEDYTFHVVSQNVSRDPHVGKAVDHADEQVLLLGIGKEFYIPLTAVVADRGKAGHLIFAAIIVHHLGEAPIHLEGFSVLCSEPASPIA